MLKLCTDLKNTLEVRHRVHIQLYHMSESPYKQYAMSKPGDRQTAIYLFAFAFSNNE
jgi:hypothetical protein